MEKYNPSTDELGFIDGQFEIYRSNTSISSKFSSIFVPLEAVKINKGLSCFLL